MSRRPDFKRLREIPIEQVCGMLNLTLRHEGFRLRGTCPICNHQDHRKRGSFTVTPSEGRYWCFGKCKSGGDGIDLVSHVRRITLFQAALEIQEHFGSR